MYSIPVYALRFAAHCRSRLRYSELAAKEVPRAPAPGATRFWIRFASHGRRAVIANCANAFGHDVPA
ncbi:MAG: hypothetical protein ABI769_16145 [Pseudomonadota bacterium]